MTKEAVKKGKHKSAPINLTSIKLVPITKLFPHEAQDFTPWMEENIDVLAERLGIPLTIVAREKEVGTFKLDLEAAGPNGERVIIENQLKKTDHDHLGKVLTYFVNIESKIAIWVTPKGRDEHVQVFEWLNKNTPRDVRFYLVEVEAFAIGENLYAPWFTVVVEPTEIGKAIGDDQSELANRIDLLQDFWGKFIAYCHERKWMTTIKKAPRDNYINVGGGKSGFAFEYLLYIDRAVVRLVIDFDSDPTGRRNKETLEFLKKHRAEIEHDFGGKLEWDRRDSARYACIKVTLEGVGINDTGKWPEIREWMLDNMKRLEKALKHRVRDLKL